MNNRIIELPGEEDLRNEFKDKELLQKKGSPQFLKLLRSVASMWNAEGGTIYVGVTDGGVVEGLGPEDLARVGLLRETIVDSIDPRLQIDSEVVLSLGSVRGLTVLTVEVKPNPSRGPACVKEGDSRVSFPKRFGKSTRPMTRAELEEAFGRTKGRKVNRDVEKELLEWVARWSLVGRSAFLFGAHLGSPLDLKEVRRQGLLVHPDPKRIRSSGWTYLSNLPGDPRSGSGDLGDLKLETGSREHLYTVGAFEAPDRVAVQILEKVYWSFGYGPENVPRFVPELGSFLYPEQEAKTPG